MLCVNHMGVRHWELCWGHHLSALETEWGMGWAQTCQAPAALLKFLQLPGGHSCLCSPRAWKLSTRTSGRGGEGVRSPEELGVRTWKLTLTVL